jgi:hypothetical protein
MFTSAIDAVARESGWAELSAVGSYIAKNDPSFDPRNYGHSRLSQMVKKLDFLTVQEQRNGSKLHSEIRLKEADSIDTLPVAAKPAPVAEAPAAASHYRSTQEAQPAQKADTPAAKG